MILMIDNYDSFTYNLVQYLRELSADMRVFRNDKISLEEIGALHPDAIVLSPGPGNPDQAGICLDVVRAFSGQVPLLGVCLGHQTIGQAFGAQVIHAKKLMHGKTSVIAGDGKGVFKDLDKVQVMRYHSLAVDEKSLPAELMVTCRTDDDGEVMGMRHVSHPTEGIQFHPESIMTPDGMKMLRNFLEAADSFNQKQAR